MHSVLRWVFQTLHERIALVLFSNSSIQSINFGGMRPGTVWQLTSVKGILMEAHA